MAVRRLSRCILLISAASVRTVFRCAISCCCEIDIKKFMSKKAKHGVVTGVCLQ